MEPQIREVGFYKEKKRKGVAVFFVLAVSLPQDTAIVNSINQQSLELKTLRELNFSFLYS